MAQPKKSIKYYTYKNKKWYLDGQPVDVSNIIIRDAYDNYWKKLLPNGTLAVQDVDENGKPIKSIYIGGTTQEARDKYWQQAPIMRHAVDSIANRYKIKPSLLRHRIDKEGFTDYNIQQHNITRNDNDIARNASNYSKLNEFNYDSGFKYFGLDDVADMIGNKVQLINENWFDSYNTNEKDRKVHSAEGELTKDNIGIMAATLKYFREQAAKDFPNSTNNFLDKAAEIYYNRGETGGKNYIKKQRKSLED